MKKYKNRYGEEYTFTELENSNILWEGDFEHCRFGWPNDYTEAYKKFKEDGGELPLEEFEEEVHRLIFDEYGNYKGQSEIAEKYQKLVKSNTEVIDMVDPSGGPYISSGMDLGFIGFSGRKVKEFKNVEDGWEIIVSLADINII